MCPGKALIFSVPGLSLKGRDQSSVPLFKDAGGLWRKREEGGWALDGGGRMDREAGGAL